MKVSLLCFDLSDNSFGRAALLAQALSRNFDIELVGPARKDEIWQPLKDLQFTIKKFPWRRYPRFTAIVPKILNAIEGDVVYACKLRPTSFGIGLLAQSEKPLLVDIDDWELGFYLRTGFWGRLGRMLNLSNPNGMPYTWLMERFVSRADGISVSNTFLQNRFGGELAYHCRDTRDLDPQRFDSGSVRRRWGLDEKKILLFLGTPRAHKGVTDLGEMMRYVRHPQAHLVVIGAENDSNEIFGSSVALNGKITLLPKISFFELGACLSAADVIVIPQRETPDTIGQMPAKIFDAMAMGKPLVSTRVSDIPEVLDEYGYLVSPGDVHALASAVDYILDHDEEFKEKGQKLRERCRKLYDLSVLEKTLASLVEKATRKKNVL